MVDIRDRLNQFGDRLAYVERAAWRAPERQAAAEDVEDLCRQLYRGIFEAGSDWLGWGKADYKEDLTPEPITGATIVPLLEPESMRLAGEMLTKTTLYSELSVVITPTAVENMYISYSGGDRRNYENGYNVVFDYNMPYRSLVTAGRCVFLPRIYTMKEESASSSWSREHYTAPLLQDPDKMRYLPANLSLPSLGKTPFQDLVVYDTLLLPYFPDAKLDDIAALAQWR